MRERADAVIFRARPRLQAGSALRVAAVTVVASVIVPLALEGRLADHGVLRAAVTILATIMAFAAVVWVVTPILGHRATVTVSPTGFSVTGENRAGGFCPWSRILDAELNTTARDETVIRVHTGFGGGVDLPLECARDPKFLALVQMYGTSANPLAVFIRNQRLA
jgi:hypothetical protein